MGIIESVQQYDLNIPAGGAQNIDVAGDRVQFLSAVDPFAQIEIRPNFAQGNISLKPGQGFKFSQQVKRWVVFNRGTVPLTGYLLIGSGDFFDQRITGTVDVIDGGKARTLGGQAFVGSGFIAGAAAAYGHVQLWNPVGSGKNIIVEAISLSAAAALGVSVRSHTSAIGALQTAGVNKMVGGAAGVGEVRTVTAAAMAGTSELYGTNVAAGNPFPWKFVEPVVLRPGYALMAVGAAQNASLTATYEWYEEI